MLCALLLCPLSASLYAQIRVEAEDYTEVKSAATEIITENDGKTIGYFDERGETLSYEVNITEDGLYQFSFRYLAGKAGSLKIETSDGASFVFQTDAYNAAEWWKLPINDCTRLSFRKLCQIHIKSRQTEIQRHQFGVRTEHRLLRSDESQLVRQQNHKDKHYSIEDRDYAKREQDNHRMWIQRRRRGHRSKRTMVVQRKRRELYIRSK